MSNAQLALNRYEGRYLVASYWDEGKHVQRFVDVKVRDDHLTVEYLAVTMPVGPGPVADRPDVERRHSEPYPLVPVLDHTFDAVGHPHRYRFELGNAVAQRVIVIRDGVPSDPGPRFVPLPQETPGRRERFEHLDLGHPTLCMTARDTRALTAFYEQLGFAPQPDRPGVLRQGWTVLGFLDFQPQPCINYRGPSILATAFELARRGYSLDGAVESTHVQGDECGGFMVYDPDGHRMFFNTHIRERSVYDAWKNGALAPKAGNHHERNTMDSPVTLPLGDLVACLDVKDLKASVRFYRGMGFAIIDQTPASVTLFSRPARENRYAFPLRLRQAGESRYSFGFLCADVLGVASSIRARGVEVISTPDGPAFMDPDGNCVTMLPVKGLNDA